MPPPSTKITTTIHWLLLILNYTIVLLVQFSIVYSLQRFSQFSLRVLMLAVPFVAMLVVLGRFLSATLPFWELCYLIHAVYLSPLIAAAAVAGHAMRTRRAGKTDLGVSNGRARSP